jgi:hypothetical protein
MIPSSFCVDPNITPQLNFFSFLGFQLNLKCSDYIQLSIPTSRVSAQKAERVINVGSPAVTVVGPQRTRNKIGGDVSIKRAERMCGYRGTGYGIY